MQDLPEIYLTSLTEISKYLKDLRKLVSRCALLKAPAGRLEECWKSMVGISDGPDVAPDSMQDATYIDHARKLLTQICR